MQGLVRGGGARDLRVDFFRGLALWFIFIDHVPGNRLGDLTLRNIAFCDATEAFVLLAGYAAGMAYGATLERRGWLFGAAALLRRAGTLYVAHIFLFVVFAAQVGYSAAILDSPAYLDELHLDPFREQPYHALLQALLLRYQPAFLDILPLYIALLVLLIPALPLLRRPALLLGLSGVIYGLARSFDLNLPNWIDGVWFFNPFGWQLLFLIGCVLGHAPPGPGGRRGPAPVVPFRQDLAAGAVAVLLLGAAAMLVTHSAEDWLALAPEGLTLMLAGIDKGALHPVRLLSILALAYLLGHAVPREAAWLRGRAVAPFLVMGQHGLPVFCAGIFLSFLGRLALEQSDRGLMQLAVNLGGLAALVAVGLVAAWYRQRERGEPAPAAPRGAGLPVAVPSSTTPA
ncbi:OpgC family protein [Paracraurococcus lichenis]|uniref:OpgC domain-containing protein n=1 Tax=Paracraurococcus lichenis TaxID=3064888 RepID=A0ABT9DWR2_9PROT|nr:OpgC domain-containing protein [Paracraurococcus sp. LOR1-02]MDO9708341.1 OpgC domain-containing protein [Paracraurococcus sp. LOR1-02]